MFLIEPERGCSRGCTYCVMRRSTNGGMRIVPPERVLALIPDARPAGRPGRRGGDRPSRASPSCSRTLVDAGREVGISSLRADRLTDELVGALRRGGARTLTVASDGASERMRDLIERKHPRSTSSAPPSFAPAAGMERLKLYMMVGLPRETDADIDELVRFTRELVAASSRWRSASRRSWPSATRRSTARRSPASRRSSSAWSGCAGGSQGRAEVRPTSARWAWVEYMLAQGGPEAGLAALDAWRAGGSFAAWKRAFAEHGSTPVLKARVPDGRRNRDRVAPHRRAARRSGGRLARPGKPHGNPAKKPTPLPRPRKG